MKIKIKILSISILLLSVNCQNLLNVSDYNPFNNFDHSTNTIGLVIGLENKDTCTNFWNLGLIGGA